MYDYILIDIDKRLDDVNLGVFEVADTIFVVMTADLSCLKNVRLILETIDHLGYPADKVQLVLNRSNAFTGINVKNAEGALRADDRPPDRQRVPRRDQRAQLRARRSCSRRPIRRSADRCSSSPAAVDKPAAAAATRGRRSLTPGRSARAAAR